MDWLFVIPWARPPWAAKFTMLNEDGKIIDDTIVMHMAEGTGGSPPCMPHFIKWADATRAYDVTYEVSPRHRYTVQGPAL